MVLLPATGREGKFPSFLASAEVYDPRRNTIPAERFIPSKNAWLPAGSTAMDEVTGHCLSATGAS